MERDSDRNIEEFGLDPNIDAQLVEVLADIRRLDRSRLSNLGILLAKFSGLSAMLRHGPPELRRNERFRQWAHDYGKTLQAAETHVQQTLGVELESELEERGFALSGHYPLLKSGLFTLELDFSRYQVTLWYGPRQERLGKCPTDAQDVANRLHKESELLGGRMSAGFFSGMLYSSYERLTEGRLSGPVPIARVVDSFVRTDRAARAMAGKSGKRSKPLGRADFSYNLFRFSEALINDGWQLRVASRSFTRRRRDFLWVPDSESGTGTYYSHIELKR